MYMNSLFRIILEKIWSSFVSDTPFFIEKQWFFLTKLYFLIIVHMCLCDSAIKKHSKETTSS